MEKLGFWYGSLFLSLLAVLLAPWLVEALPKFFETVKNIILWLIWLVKYRQRK